MLEGGQGALALRAKVARDAAVLDARKRLSVMLVLVPFLLLGGVFVLMTLGWLAAHALIAVRASAVLWRSRAKALLDRLTGAVLIGLGVRLATAHR